MRWLVLAAVMLMLFVAFSTLATYLYGQFAATARGEPSTALERSEDGTALDRMIVPMIGASPGKSGLALLSSNVDAFAVRGLGARMAERSLDVMYYIWADDLTGRLLLNELVMAADRGVRVRLLLDDIGVGHGNEAMSALVQHPMIEIRLFNPTRARPGGLRRGIEMMLRVVSVTRRMHNKAWIADGRVAVVGGRNVGGAYFDAGDTSNFKDLDLVTMGPVVDQIEQMFDEYWNSPVVIPIDNLRDTPSGTAKLERYRSTLAEIAGSAQARPYLDHVHTSNSLAGLLDKRLYWDGAARLLSDPAAKGLGKDVENWLMQQLVPVLTQVEKRLEITSPYFIPGVEGTAQLVELAGRGAEVIILTNSLSATDVAAVHGGYAPYRVPLLAGGVQIYELAREGEGEELSFRGSSGASLHTKAFTVDSRTGFVGSLNFDPRSASLNTEMGVLFSAPELIDEMHHIFAGEIRPSVSYRLSLDAAGKLQWHDERQTYVTEPETSIWRRAFARIVGWLPLESQL